MQDLIARYLLYKKELSLKGIGTFSLKNVSAFIDFPNRLLHAPKTILEFSSNSSDDESFFQWLGAELQITFSEAKNKTTQFIQLFLQKVNQFETIDWKGIGSFRKSAENVLQFQPVFETFTGDAVKAEKIIRKNVEHIVRVGEQEKTTTQMEELLTPRPKGSVKRWWWFAIVLFIFGIAALWYFALNNAEAWKMQGNGNKIKTQQTEPTYKKL